MYALETATRDRHGRNSPKNGKSRFARCRALPDESVDPPGPTRFQLLVEFRASPVAGDLELLRISAPFVSCSSRRRAISLVFGESCVMRLFREKVVSIPRTYA